MAVARTGFRIYTFRRIEADDGFLVFAVWTLTAAFTIVHFVLPLEFSENATSLGVIKPGPDFPMTEFKAKNLQTASSAMVWATVYAVKYSYMFFFKRLVRRVKKIEIWWWIVFGILVPISLAGCLFDFTICPVFGEDFIGEKSDLHKRFVHSIADAGSRTMSDTSHHPP